MYKKRLAQWGLYKNSRSKLTPRACDECAEKLSRSPTTLSRLCLTKREEMVLLFMTSVRNWSTAYFEDVQVRLDLEDDIAIQNSFMTLPAPDGVKQSSIAFNLVVELLNRGQGALAGRVARKAFLLIEDTLLLESPALVWNLLEIMYHMIVLGHVKLYQLLLAHLTALVGRRMSMSHPLAHILRALRGVVATIPEPLPELIGKSPDSDNSGTFDAGCFFPEILERAWNLNAEMVFDHFHPRLFELYFRIHWDSCHLKPPPAVIGALKRYYIAEEPMAEYPYATKLPTISRPVEAAIIQRLRGDKHPFSEEAYGTICTALWSRIETLLQTEDYSNVHTATLLRILAGLVKAKFLQEQPEIFKLPDFKTCNASTASRVHASNVACAMRTLVDLEDHDPEGEPLDTVELSRAIVALREYSDGETHPQVIQEMWSLEDALRNAGEDLQAQAVRGQAMHRLEAYIQDIPIDHV